MPLGPENPSNPKLAYVIYDTNVALHYKRADQIDWLTLTRCARVVLVATPIFLKELDRHKYSHSSRRIRDRASAYMSWLVEFRSGDQEIRPSVKWEFVLREPTLDFTANALSKESADDHLIASAIELGKSIAGRLFLATADGYLLMKTAAHGIMALGVPESDRLPIEHDPVEKENQELRRELAKLTARMPKNSLYFSANRKQHLDVELKLRSNVDDQESIYDIRRTHPLLPDPVPSSLSSLYEPGSLRQTGVRSLDWSLGGPSARRAHNLQLQRFYDDWMKYLDALLEWRGAMLRTLRVELVLANEGTATATDVDVTLSFPSQLVLSTEEDLPKAPEPPQRPKAFPQSLLEPSLGAYARPLFARQLGPNLYNPSLVIDPGGGTVTFHAASLKHENECLLDAFFIRFPTRESIAPFAAKFSISAIEPIRPTLGDLHFIPRVVVE